MKWLFRTEREFWKCWVRQETLKSLFLHKQSQSKNISLQSVRMKRRHRVCFFFFSFLFFPYTINKCNNLIILVYVFFREYYLTVKGDGCLFFFFFFLKPETNLTKLNHFKMLDSCYLFFIIYLFFTCQPHTISSSLSWQLMHILFSVDYAQKSTFEHVIHCFPRVPLRLYVHLKGLCKCIFSRYHGFIIYHFSFLSFLLPREQNLKLKTLVPLFYYAMQ